MSDKNIATVQAIYEAFGRGDVAAVLDAVADDADWATYEDSSVAPWYGIHKGKDEIPKFFQGIAATHEVTEFTPLAFTSNDTDVIAVIRYGMRAKATGKSATMNLYHWFQFNEAGKIVRYRGAEDSALVAELLRP